MRFEKFEISNFKGIKEAELPLDPRGAGIFSLIGLNESGKTTILEAVNSFEFTEDKHAALYSDKKLRRDRTSFIPKHQKSNFTDMVSIIGHLAMTEYEREQMAARVEQECGCTVDRDSITLKLQLHRGFEFKNSDYVDMKAGIPVSLMVKRPRGRKFIYAGNDQAEWKSFAKIFLARVPEIIYFPTFLFSQPDRIYLCEGKALKVESVLNKLYRQIFESVAASLMLPLNLREHVVARAVSDDKSADKREQLDASLNDLSTSLTDIVFDGWTKVFGGGAAGREVVVRSDVEDVEGEKVVYLEIFLREGGQTFRLSERSTGFRWFFSFILFTTYRMSEKEFTLFLLDEPASNLHAKGQAQLIESLRRIASDTTEIIYSTHSHYMINPDWLDQSFIVSNSSVNYDENLGAGPLRRPSPTSVDISRYRNFVGKNPDKMTYFQPILDSLSVVPSRIDLVKKSVLTEGKSDYLLMQYGLAVKHGFELSAAIVPTRGATGMDELIGLFKGWGVPFLIVLDDDREGKAAAKRYIGDWHLPSEQVLTLADVLPEFRGKDVRAFLERSDEILIGRHFGVANPNKSQFNSFLVRCWLKEKW